jgi:teichuronic acid biosynthesis glycosyltransferase TuaG
MKSEDKISVLICVHSTDHQHDMLLQRALESLVRQTYSEFETIVVMDECHEETESIVRAYKDVLNLRDYKRPRKQGLASAKNYGLQWCTGDWIAYLDADDEWMDCKLEVQRKFLMANPYVSFCFTGAWDRIDDILYPNCFQIGQYDTHEQIAARLLQENCLCHGSALINKGAIMSLNGYRTDRSVVGQEDWDLWKRAMTAGLIFAKVPERLYIYSLGTSVAR